MAMDVVTVAFEVDCTMQTASLNFSLGIPIPPGQAVKLKEAMDNGDWATMKAQAKTFAPIAVSGALDYLISVAPQKNTPAKKPTEDPTKK